MHAYSQATPRMSPLMSRCLRFLRFLLAGAAPVYEVPGTRMSQEVMRRNTSTATMAGTMLAPSSHAPATRFQAEPLVVPARTAELPVAHPRSLPRMVFGP